LVLGYLTDKLVLRPSRNPIPAVGKQRRMVPFGRSQVEVWCQRFGPSSAATTTGLPDLYVFKLGGVGSRAERQTGHPLDFWTDLSADVWAMNPPGYGGSSGRASLKTWIVAAQVVFEYLQAQAGDRPILITGNSLGTASALFLAARHEIAGLILRNPIPLGLLIAGHYGGWSLGLGSRAIAAQVPAAFDSIRNASSCTCPAIFVTCNQDSVAPPSYQHPIREAYGGPLRYLLLPDADHASLLQPHELAGYRELLEWLKTETLPVRSSQT